MTGNQFKYPTELASPSQLLVGVVVDNGDDVSKKPAKDNSGGFRVFIPTLHNKTNFKYEDLPLVRYLGDATQGAVQSFGGPPERGSVVLLSQIGGQGPAGDYIVMGVFPNNISKSPMPGTTMLNQFFQDAVDTTINKKRPPGKLSTTTRDGAEIRQVQDTGMWSNRLVDGIPSSATLWPMSGIFLPQVSSVATAIQHSTDILNSSILSSLPGISMSLGGLLSNLNASGLLSQITANMPSDLATALNSISNLITQVESSSSYGFAVGGRVDEETYVNNAVNILSAAASIQDIVDGMNRLMYDDTLYGTENLEPVRIKCSTPYGNTYIEVSHNGTVNSTINVANVIASNGNTQNVITQAARNASGNQEEEDDNKNYLSSILSFVNMLSSPSQAFAASGENMFGNSAPRMVDLFNRMNPEATSHMKNLVETVNIGEKEQKTKEVSQPTIFGGNPLKGIR